MEPCSSAPCGDSDGHDLLEMIVPSQLDHPREQPIYRCLAGHRVRSAALVHRCHYCRRKLDASLLRYFRRVSQEMLKGAG